MKDTRTCIPNVKGKDLKPVGVGKHSIYDVRPTGDTVYYPWVQMAEVHVKHGDAIRIILLDEKGNGFSSIFTHFPTFKMFSYFSSYTSSKLMFNHQRSKFFF